MIQPDFLKEGDKIAIVAPAKRMLNGELQEAIELIKSWKLIHSLESVLNWQELWENGVRGEDQHSLDQVDN